MGVLAWLKGHFLKWIRSVPSFVPYLHLRLLTDSLLTTGTWLPNNSKQQHPTHCCPSTFAHIVKARPSFTIKLQQSITVTESKKPSQKKNMAGAYELRTGGDSGKNKKQSMADLKLRRLNELNIRLKEDLERPRTTVREASLS